MRSSFNGADLVRNLFLAIDAQTMFAIRCV